MDKFRACRVCKVEKPLTVAHFPTRKSPSGNRYFRPDCKACSNELLRAKACERMQRLRAKDGGAGARKAVKKWKDANPVLTVAHRESRISQRVPIAQRPRWGNRPGMQEVYRTARLLRDLGQDITVDHIIPLHSPLVCGLHVLNNLNFMELGENRAKGNSFDPWLHVEPIW